MAQLSTSVNFDSLQTVSVHFKTVLHVPYVRLLVLTLAFIGVIQVEPVLTNALKTSDGVDALHVRTVTRVQLIIETFVYI